MSTEIESILKTVTWAQESGIYVVQIARGEKNPNRAGWQAERHADPVPIFLREPLNVGAVLGEPSGNLIDVDVDHAAALPLAAEILPPTGRVYGRASKRRSHYLFFVNQIMPTRQFRFPDTMGPDGKKIKGAMVVEFRSTGGQSVLPGSLHPSGELIEWDQEGEMGVVDAHALMKAVEDLARRVGATVKPPAPPAREHRSAPATHFRDKSRADRCQRYLQKLPDALAGHGGHDSTFHAACVIFNFGLSDIDAWEAINWFNEQKCFPKWEQKELQHKLTDAKAKVIAANSFGKMGAAPAPVTSVRPRGGFRILKIDRGVANG